VNLKAELISWMEQSQLRGLCRELAIEADLHSRDDMQEALRSARRAKPERLITALDDEQLRRLLERHGLPRDGARATLMQRLLEAGGRTASPSAASPDGTADGAESELPAAPTQREGASTGATRSSRSARARKPSNSNGANIGYEAELWKSADLLRGSMDAAEYKHVVLGLLFLKYISDAFEERHAELVAEAAQGADPEDRDEYRAEGIFWVPAHARWARLKASARQPTIGQTVDAAMEGIEADNPSLRGVLPKDYARPALDKTRLGQIIDLVSNIRVGDADARSRDVLGRVYEYFLSQFASAEGRKGGEFYTPRAVVRLLVEMLEPYRGRVYDPCCGSAGMFVQSIEFIRAHANGNGNGGRARADLSIYGQESNYTTWRLARMNLAIRGIDGHIAHGDTFHNDRHPDLKADFILANPPFNISDWGGERLKEDQRWRYGCPPAGNANFAWLQHIVHHLAPGGVAGVVLANGSMSSNQSGEGEIRRQLIENDLVDCMVALPGQLFYSTQIPACLWFLARDRRALPAPRSRGAAPGEGQSLRDRRGELLFIDARKLGVMADRTHRDLTDAEVKRIADTYHAWRGEADAGAYRDIPGFCRSATLEEVRRHGHVLTPGRYVGAEAALDDGEPFEEKMKRLVATLREQQAEASRLDAAIAANLKELGFDS
jgi:type I restriction enzyme M protein